MYQEQDEAAIKSRMLSNVSSDYDKTEGGLMHDTIAPAALELEQVYIELGNVVEKLNIENLSGAELEIRVYQRTSIKRKLATYSHGYLQVTGDMTIKVDDLFQTETGVQFRAVEEKIITGSGNFDIMAVLPGPIGNIPANTIRYMPINIVGIVSITNPETTEGGYPQETDKELRQRYYEYIQRPPTSGNKAQYKLWAKEITGVGEAKVIPLWAGDNTVKVVIVDSNKQPPSQELITEVQSYIDPMAKGEGDGVAPMGAKCTVTGAAGKAINVTVTATKDVAVSDAVRKAAVETSITEYLKDIAFKDTAVSYAKVGNAILASKGILDYAEMKINGGNANINIGFEEVAVLGVVTIA